MSDEVGRDRVGENKYLNGGWGCVGKKCYLCGRRESFRIHVRAFILHQA